MFPFSTSDRSFRNRNGIELEFEEIIEAIDKEMARVGWSIEDGKEYLSDRYNKGSRRFLTDEELLEFWEYLKKQ